MKANISYNDDGEAYSINVNYAGNARASATLVGSTAVITSIQPMSGEDRVYGEDCVKVLNYLESLPMVQASQFGEVDDE